MQEKQTKMNNKNTKKRKQRGNYSRSSNFDLKLVPPQCVLATSWLPPWPEPSPQPCFSNPYSYNLITPNATHPSPASILGTGSFTKQVEVKCSHESIFPCRSYCFDSGFLKHLNANLEYQESLWTKLLQKKMVLGKLWSKQLLCKQSSRCVYWVHWMKRICDKWKLIYRFKIF